LGPIPAGPIPAGLGPGRGTLVQKERTPQDLDGKQALFAANVIAAD
jgi:hypothetical protein